MARLLPTITEEDHDAIEDDALRRDAYAVTRWAAVPAVDPSTGPLVAELEGPRDDESGADAFERVMATLDAAGFGEPATRHAKSLRAARARLG